MDVPSKYGVLITNQKDPNKTARYSFNGYDKRQLFKMLISSWDKDESEMSFNLLIEILISFYLKDLIITYINYFGENVILQNIKYSFKLAKILKKYKDITKSLPKRGTKMFIINSTEVRNLFAELNSDIFSLKKTSYFVKNISNNCFSEEIIAKNTKLTHIDVLYDKEDKEIPTNLSRGIQEILYRIDNYFSDNFIDNTFFWLNWLLKAEKRDKKLNPKKIKEMVFNENSDDKKKNKFANDWFIYFTKKILTKSKSCQSKTTKVLVKSLMDIAKFEYNSSRKKDRLPYLVVAIYIIHKDKDVSLLNPIHNINIFSVLNINKFFENIIPSEDRRTYQKQYEEVREELLNQRILEREEIQRTKNYKKAKLNNKMDYLNIVIYKDEPKAEVTENPLNESSKISRKITDYL